MSKHGDLWIRFAEWHEANPHVWLLFVRFTFQALQTGRGHYSARDIVHRIRWHTNVELASVDEFKINDHWSPYYARVFMACYPAHASIFETRESEDDPVTREAITKKMRDQLNREWGKA